MQSDRTNANTPHRRLRVFSTLVSTFGGAIIVFAFLADRLGYGDASGIGIGQLLLAWVGFFALLVGLIGKRTLDVYRVGAIMLLNTLVLLALIELGAIFISRSSQRVRSAEIEQLSYYATQDWANVYWREARLAENYTYKPYVIWQHRPFEGRTVNISQQGIRQTPGAECVADAYRAFTFGGSTMLGWGAPDWGTIPAHLQQGLEEIIGEPVCVVNMGEDGFVSTQSLVALLLQLQSGNVPNMVIFYDGINEVQAAYESGQSAAHVTLAKIAARFEEQEHPLIKWFKGSRQYTLLEKWVDKSVRTRGETTPDVNQGQATEMDRLAGSVAEVYLSNYRIVGALAREYGFDYLFFLQPQLAIGEKPLTKEEQTMRSRMDPGWVSLANAVYGRIASTIPGQENLWDLTDVFDGEDAQVWIDEVGHITPEGNRLIAQEMIAEIEKHLAEK